MVRAAAAYALLKLGSRASDAAPQLTVTIADAEPFVRNMAEKALLEVNNKEQNERCQPGVLRCQNFNVRRHMLKV
jgi:hypothetical protein